MDYSAYVPLGARQEIDELLSGNETTQHQAMAQSAEDIKCLERFAVDPRMREAYTLLNSEFNKDREWRSFIFAAWAARVDFTQYRERLIQASRIKKR